MRSIAQHQEPPILNITGEKVALGPLRRDLLPLYQKWNNDFEAIRLAGMPVRPQTWEAAEAWYEQAGRQEALRRGLKVAGTLSVLDEADQAGLVIFDNANQ